MSKKVYKPRIFSVTGTKGKTSIIRLLSHIYTKQKRPTLSVDTDGFYYNTKMLGTLEESKILHGFGPTIAPGKFLYTIKYKKNSIAILETALGSSTVSGLGYYVHDIGLFTNVFEDHIGRRVRNRKALAREKSSFIFARIAEHGTAIFNADNSYVCNELHMIPDNMSVKLLPVGFKFNKFDLKKHLKKNGKAVTIKDNWIGILSQNKFTKVINVEKISWTFNGLFNPSIWNLMFVIATLYADSGFKSVPKEQKTLIYNYKLDNTGGRLTIFENKKDNIKVMVDYAHEKYSLKEVGKLIKKLSSNKTIGVVRLAADRTNKLIDDTAKYISNIYDILVVYDRIDGVKRKKLVSRKTGIIRKAGETSMVFFNSLKKYKKNKNNVYRVLEEEDAFKKAMSLAESGDYLLHICDSDHNESINIVKKYLFKK